MHVLDTLKVELMSSLCFYRGTCTTDRYTHVSVTKCTSTARAIELIGSLPSSLGSTAGGHPEAITMSRPGLSARDLLQVACFGATLG